MNTYPQLAPSENPTTSMSKEAIAWRYEFSKASNAIEDAPTDPGLDAIYKQLIAEGITDFDEQIDRPRPDLLTPSRGPATAAAVMSTSCPCGQRNSYRASAL